MSTLATYAFTDKDGYEAAIYKISSEFGSNSYDKSYNSEYWFLHILSDCSNEREAGRICSANGGKSY